MRNSTLNVLNNKSIVFDGNVSNYSGGAIHAQNSSVHFKGNDLVLFDGNIADNGGAIMMAGPTYMETSPLLFESNKKISFCGNSASMYGGAIDIHYDGSDVHVFQNNVGDKAGDVAILFEGNSAYYRGGAIMTFHMLHFLNNGGVVFKDNGRERMLLRVVLKVVRFMHPKV